MAESTGSAREEAERLVATVLAMAARSGMTRPGGLGETVAGLVDQFTGAAGGRSSGDGSSGAASSGAASSDAASSGAASSGAAFSDAASSGPASSGAAGGGSADAGGPAGEARAGAAESGARAGAAGSGDPDSETAASFFGAFSRGAAGWHGPGGAWATGSAECCVCPVCRVIANLRDPSPHAMERLATGAGDFATGLASLMRGVSAMTGERHRPTRPRPAPPRPDPDAMWTAATRRGAPPAPAPEPDEHDSPWAAATRAPAPAPEPAPDRPAAPKVAEPAASAAPAATAAQPAPAAAPAPPPVTPRATSRRVGGDVWAAATADKTVTDVSPPRAVDHDDPGAATGHGSAPAAEAAEDPDAGAGDDARTGGGV